MLTVGVLPTFTRIGGTVRSVRGNGRMRFAVNVSVGAAHPAASELALLKLAKIVKDDTNAAPR